MAIIKHQGAPNRQTKGAIGDIFVNTVTGDKYTCTFAYFDGVNGEYDWKLTEKSTKKPVLVKEEKVIEPVVEKVDTVIAEEPASEERPRTNYAKQYQKGNRK